jgi:hypothetical protein
MKLYHFTTANSQWLMTRGIGRVIRELSCLNPGHGSEVCHSHTPGVVYDNWDDFFKNPIRNWFCNSKSIPCLDNIDLWRNSRELGRLLYFIKERSGFNFNGFALASFETNAEDNLWVCEADFLRRYHERELNSYDSHIAFAESRVELPDYRGQFKLPEYRVGNPIELKRIKWLPVPEGLELIELTTSSRRQTFQEASHF